jgi:hypothetical protein
MGGILFKTLDRLPEPMGMIVAWLLYLGMVGVGFCVSMWLVGLLGPG